MNGTPVTPELTAQIEKLHNEGKSQSRIAAELGIGKSTVYRVLKRLADNDLPIGNVSHEDAERLKEIGEKTGLPISYNYSEGADADDDIYAYDGSMSREDFNKRIDMAQKEEPAAAATVTSPKDTISETIIPDVAENVKTSITESVLEACRIYREDRLEKIEEERKYLATLEKELAELESFLEANK